MKLQLPPEISDRGSRWKPCRRAAAVAARVGILGAVHTMVFGFTLSALAHQATPPEKPAIFPYLVAKVNGTAILGKELENRIQIELAPLGNPEWHKLRTDFQRELISESMATLIGAELIYQDALSQGIRVGPQEVEESFQKVANSFATEVEMDQVLSSQGMNREGLKKEVERSMVVDQYIEKVISPRAKVSDEELRQYYQQQPEQFRHPDLYRTSHVLVMVADQAGEEKETIARAKAEGLLKRAQSGEDFATLAKEHSEDVTSERGGDVGFTREKQLAPEYEKAAMALDIGEISGLVRSQFGYHVIKLTGRKKAGLSSFDEIRDQLRQFLEDQKTEEQLAEHVEKLRSRATISLFL